MADPLLERYRSIRCPPGSRAEMDLDQDSVGCFTPEGEQVAELARAGLGVVGTAAVIAGALALAAELYKRW